MELVPVKKSFE